MSIRGGKSDSDPEAPNGARAARAPFGTLAGAPGTCKKSEGGRTMHSHGPIRVMLVDDHIESLISIARLLRVLGYDVRVAPDGPRALASAERFHPEAALIDLSLPGMDGFTIARRLRAMDWARRSLLIAMTGWESDEYTQRTREVGFDAHLVKPLSADALTDALSAARLDLHP
jgi:two-component system, chemotaxis family, CheB/CheR fusion protein